MIGRTAMMEIPCRLGIAMLDAPACLASQRFNFV